MGSTSYVTDKDGELYEHVQYFPFGETWVHEHSNTEKLPYLYTSKELDEETGLYYFGARYYDPRTSVWQSTDPILPAHLGTGTTATSWHLPAYTQSLNNPLIFFDPTGEEEKCVDGACFSYVAPGELSETSVDPRGHRECHSGGCQSVETPGAAEFRRKAWQERMDELQKKQGLEAPAIDPIDVVSGAGLAKTSAKLGGKLITKAVNAKRMDRVRKLGNAGEAAAGIKKNTERIDSATGTAKYRVPDILDHRTPSKVIAEVAVTPSAERPRRDGARTSRLVGVSQTSITLARTERAVESRDFHVADARGPSRSRARSRSRGRSGCAPVIVMQPAEHWQRDELARSRWRTTELRVRIGDLARCLRRPRPVVILDEAAHGAQEMALVQEDDVVEALLAERLVEALDVRVGVWRAVGNGDAAHAQRMMQPAVELAAEGPLLGALAELAEDAVVVMDQKLRRRLEGSGLPDLSLDPIERRAGGRVDADDAAGSELHHDEDVDWDGEVDELDDEVASPDAVGFILQEGAPLLRWRPRRLRRVSRRRPAVASNGARVMAYAELGLELESDLVGAELGMLAADGADEVDVLLWDARAAETAATTPEERERAPSKVIRGGRGEPER